MDKGKVLCWICEKEIPNEVFGLTVLTTSGHASSCKKHATHQWVRIGANEIQQTSYGNNTRTTNVS